LVCFLETFSGERRGRAARVSGERRGRAGGGVRQGNREGDRELLGVPKIFSQVSTQDIQ
jgi:hypothetical protein